MSAHLTSDIRPVPLWTLRFSTTPAQQERREHFDKSKLSELAASIKSHGLVQPILVRPIADSEDYEVVAGERRALAAKEAGLEEITATIRELTDEQVLELQLIENLQRQDLHELVEAEGYESLQKLGHSIDDISAKVGKSKATIYARMKLLALDPSSRKFFHEGKISASIALLIARIPVASLQRKACGEIVNTRGDEPMSYRGARDHIEEHYMLRLAEAPFDTKAEDLVRGALPCGRCPKNTLSQPELFGDVKADRVGVCTDPGCFTAKREAYANKRIAQAKSEGLTVLEGKAAKEVFPYGTHSAHGGYVRLDSEEYVAGSYRKVNSLMGKDVKPVLVKAPETGELIEVVKDTDLRKAIKDKGFKVERGNGTSPVTAAEKKAKAERAFRMVLYRAIRPKLPKLLGGSDLQQLAMTFFLRHQHETQKVILKLWDLEPTETKRHGYVAKSNEAPMRARLAKMSDAEIVQLLHDCTYAEELQAFTYSNEKPEALLAAAKRLKVDVEKLRKDLAAAAKPAPAKASKKQAARK